MNMYTPHVWIPRLGTNLNRYTKANETANSVDLVNAPEAVSQQGTPFSTDIMNEMEAGITDANAGIGLLATCDTAAATQIKEIDMSDYTIKAGMHIDIDFTYGNTVGSVEDGGIASGANIVTKGAGEQIRIIGNNGTFLFNEKIGGEYAGSGCHYAGDCHEFVITTMATGNTADTAGIIKNKDANGIYNKPRLVPKDITSYVTDGSLWDRIAGTNGYTLHEDIFVGDYIRMSRAISAYDQTQAYQITGSQYVTIAGIDTLQGNGDNIDMAYEHLVMVPGMGFGGTQHFGRSRMNSPDTTVGGDVASEMHATTLGAVATAGSTVATATINQQLYAEFGAHLKTTRELLSNSINSSGYNRFGDASGCSNNYSWYSCQAVLMSEVECYGSIAWSSSGYDTGVANRQMPLFKYSKYAQNNRSSFWLKDIASSSYFCTSESDGHSACHSASLAKFFVRPRFVIA